MSTDLANKRFYQKVHLWTGARSIWGYGRLKRGGVMYAAAHRVAWELANGPVPDGRFVLHRCDVRSCVNPDHLFLGTQLDNVNDMYAKGRHPNSRKPPGLGAPARPALPLKKRLVVRIAAPLINKLKTCAELDGRPLSSYVRKVLAAAADKRAGA
jgi:hypothetical protein